MKLLIVAFALVAIVAAEWTPKNFEQVKAIRDECLAENPIPEELVQQVKTTGTYPDVESVRKYILCNAKKLDIFCSHEGWHVDRVVKQFKLKTDEAEATEIAEKCADKNEQKDSADVWAFRGHQCLWNSKLGEGIKSFIKEKKAAGLA